MVRWFFLLGLVGCATSISADEFDTSCSSPSDCTLVFTGNLCGYGCPVPDAINAADYPRFDAVKSLRANSCMQYGMLGCQSSAPHEATCIQNECVAVPVSQPTAP